MNDRLLSGRSWFRVPPGPPQTPPRISDLREAWISFEPRIECQCARFRDDSGPNPARTNRLAAQVILAPDKQRAGKMVGTAPIYGGMREVLLEAWRSWQSIAVQSVEGSAIAAPSQPQISSTTSSTASTTVIHRPDGSPVVDIRKAWARATKAAGCEGLRFHDLRACAASNLIDAGVPQIEAQKILGHKTASMFERYHIVSTGRLNEIGALMDRREKSDEKQADVVH